MGTRFGIKSAIEAIEKKGALLVFPLENKKEPSSLWNEFHPRTKMRWEWDTTGDNRVAELWHLREQLSRSGKVVYSKWYKGRATFFSKDVFSAMLRLMQSRAQESATKQEIREGSNIRQAAQTMLEALEIDSPLSTKQLKEVSELKGKANERIFTRATQELWLQFLIVGFGEIDDGAFPSLAMGATQNLFEVEFKRARKMTDDEAKQILDKYLPKTNPFRIAFEKNLNKQFLFRTQATLRAPVTFPRRPDGDF